MPGTCPQHRRLSPAQACREPVPQVILDSVRLSINLKQETDVAFLSHFTSTRVTLALVGLIFLHVYAYLLFLL